MSTLTDAVAAPLAPGGAAGEQCSTVDCVATGVAKARDPVDADDAAYVPQPSVTQFSIMDD